jgi:hypothetical protein
LRLGFAEFRALPQFEQLPQLHLIGPVLVFLARFAGCQAQQQQTPLPLLAKGLLVASDLDLPKSQESFPAALLGQTLAQASFELEHQ